MSTINTGKPISGSCHLLIFARLGNRRRQLKHEVRFRELKRFIFVRGFHLFLKVLGSGFEGVGVLEILGLRVEGLGFRVTGYFKVFGMRCLSLYV